jgi:hypothetical protein
MFPLQTLAHTPNKTKQEMAAHASDNACSVAKVEDRIHNRGLFLDMDVMLKQQSSKYEGK